MFTKKDKLDSSNHKIKKQLLCEIILLDPNEANINISVNSTENGCVLFNNVCDKVGGDFEKDYFGLMYCDKHGQQQWLELTKPICKQIKEKYYKKPSQLFGFRFKHYPKDPISDLKQDLTKYLLYLQLRRDLFHGKLVGSQNDELRLAALIMQAEIGNVQMMNGDLQRLAELDILPSVNRTTEKKIISIQDSFKDLDPCNAEKLFLEEASKLEMYGVKPIPVKDQKGNDIFIGLTSEGISTYSSGKRMHTFLWPTIAKLSFSNKMFLFQVIIDNSKHMLGFKCGSSKGACALWKWALDRKCFFTLDKASVRKTNKAGGSLFKRKKSYTFSGRSQQEISSSCQTLDSQIQVTRTNKLKSDSETDEPLSNGLTEPYTLPLPQEEQGSFCDSSADEILTKSMNKIVKNKPTSAAIGAVLDFMQALNESPLLPRQFEHDSLLPIDSLYTDNYSQHSKETNEDCDFDFLNEMIDIADAQQNNLLLKDHSDVDEKEMCNSINYDTNQSSPNPCTEFQDHSNTSYCIISLVLFGLSILLGAIKIIYFNIMQSPENLHNDVKNIFSINWIAEYFKNFFSN